MGCHNLYTVFYLFNEGEILLTFTESTHFPMIIYCLGRVRGILYNEILAMWATTSLGSTPINGLIYWYKTVFLCFTPITYQWSYGSPCHWLEPWLFWLPFEPVRLQVRRRQWSCIARRIEICEKHLPVRYHVLGGGSNIFLFSPLFGKDFKGVETTK